jgi:hypothetical protein
MHEAVAGACSIIDLIGGRNGCFINQVITIIKP